MKKFSAIVKDGSRLVIIENQEYATKGEFIRDLLANGYRVNPKKVKPSDVFDYIMQHTNCEPKDWELQAVPQETSEDEPTGPKFEVGKTYATRSICDHECIFKVKIIKRTAKTVTYEYMGDTRRSKIYTDENGEYIQPDHYSMAPTFRAGRDEVVEEPAKEEPTAESAAGQKPAESSNIVHISQYADENTVIVMVGQRVEAFWGAGHPMDYGTVVGFESVPDGKFSRGGVYALIRWDDRPERLHRTEVSEIHRRGWRSAGGSPIGVFIAG